MPGMIRLGRALLRPHLDGERRTVVGRQSNAGAVALGIEGDRAHDSPTDHRLNELVPCQITPREEASQLTLQHHEILGCEASEAVSLDHLPGDCRQTAEIGKGAWPSQGLDLGSER